MNNFLSVIDEISSLERKKGADYGTHQDTNANLRAGEPYGVPGWLHAHIMCQHKANRVQSYVEKGKLENEDVRESLLDLAVYAIKAIELFDSQ